MSSVFQEDWGAATILMLRRSHEVLQFLHHFGMLIQLGYRFRLIRISLRLVLLGQGQFPDSRLGTTGQRNLAIPKPGLCV